MFTPSESQIKHYDYRCNPCRYRYVQKEYLKDKPTYNRDWLRVHREELKIYRKKRHYGPKEKQKAQQVRAKKCQIIQQAKDKPCADCGVKYIPFVMHFDHRDPSTKFRNVSLMGSYSKERILAEIAKCDVVCANCHAKRTYYGMLDGTVKIFGGVQICQ